MKTVNVIVLDGASVDELHSFADDAEGNAKAEQKFLELMNENIWNINDYTETDMQDCLDDGVAIYGTHSIVITHSEG